MRQWFLFLITIIMTGCAHHSDSIDLEPYTKLSCNSISILTPDSYPNFPWWAWQINADKIIAMKRHLPNMMSEDVRITVQSIPQNEIANDYLLYKNQSNQMEERYKNFEMSDWEKKNNAERGVNYVKIYIDFIGGLKCGTRVESSNIALGVGTKSYQTNCTYFDNQNGAKNIHLDYYYTYTHSHTKYDGDQSSSMYSAQTMQAQFKHDMKAIFDSLVIHDMDRERMGKEGLLHDKKYDVESEYR